MGLFGFSKKKKNEATEEQEVLDYNTPVPELDGELPVASLSDINNDTSKFINLDGINNNNLDIIFEESKPEVQTVEQEKYISNNMYLAPTKQFKTTAEEFGILNNNIKEEDTVIPNITDTLSSNVDGVNNISYETSTGELVNEHRFFAEDLDTSLSEEKEDKDFKVTTASDVNPIYGDSSIFGDVLDGNGRSR